MNAIRFIKEHGVEKAREVVATYHGIPSYTFKEKTCCGYSACQSVDLSELKRLVESVGMVKDHGGLETIRKCVEKTIFPLSDRIIRMKKAIADYEVIYES